MKVHRLVPLTAIALMVGLAAAACTSSTDFSNPNDPLAAEQYAIVHMGMSDAWSQSDGSGTVIAIIDTGIDLEHPDLKDHIVAGWDWVDDDDTPNDENGHGTHVAGSAAAIGNNAIGVIGMAPAASIMPLKVLGADGTGNSQDIAEAIIWATDHGADVINLSLGGSSDLVGRIYNKIDPANQAIVDAEAKGVVVVAAAGNDDTFLRAYARDTPVLVVNASNEFRGTARFSNFGDPRAVSAPGARIMSTAPTYPTTIWPEGSDGYERLDGTSMASPQIAGVAALMVGRGESPAEIRESLIATAANPEDDPLLGAGIVRADFAVSESTSSDSNLIWVLLILGGIIAGFIAWERHRNA